MQYYACTESKLREYFLELFPDAPAPRATKAKAWKALREALHLDSGILSRPSSHSSFFLPRALPRLSSPSLTPTSQRSLLTLSPERKEQRKKEEAPLVLVRMKASFLSLVSCLFSPSLFLLDLTILAVPFLLTKSSCEQEEKGQSQDGACTGHRLARINIGDSCTY